MRAVAAAGYRSRVSLTRALPAAAAVLLALSGCTLMAPGSLAPTATPEPYRIEHSEVVEALGAVPEGEPMTPERTADFVSRFLDQQWELVSVPYPDAVRPTVAQEEDADGGINACISEASGTPKEAAIAQYVCFARFPSPPSNMLTHDQARYLYDYWTGFVVPCYRDNGFDVQGTPPARETFVAEWPLQHWAPMPVRDGESVYGDQYDELESLCPGVVDELR